jgi:hypothetical protein
MRHRKAPARLESAAVGTARTASALRTSALIALGVFTVHQLRYLTAYGGHAGTALAAQGHAYLLVLVPVLVIVAASAVLGTLVAAALSSRPLMRRRRAAGWAFCTTALLAAFGAQELAEGALATGHADGAAAVAAHGGWIVVPIAIAVGRVVSFLIGGLDAVERRLSRAARRRLGRAPAALGRQAARVIAPLECGAFAFGLAGRPPPRLPA